jgi:hypothetical protein
MGGRKCLEGKVVVLARAGRATGREAARPAAPEGGKVVVGDLGRQCK